MMVAFFVKNVGIDEVAKNLVAFAFDFDEIKLSIE